MFTFFCLFTGYVFDLVTWTSIVEEQSRYKKTWNLNKLAKVCELDYFYLYYLQLTSLEKSLDKNDSPCLCMKARPCKTW